MREMIYNSGQPSHFVMALFSHLSPPPYGGASGADDDLAKIVENKPQQAQKACASEASLIITYSSNCPTNSHFTAVSAVLCPTMYKSGLKWLKVV
jgi:hypothetical protein